MRGFEDWKRKVEGKNRRIQLQTANSGGTEN
jgi:hypothetical protein